MKHRWKKVSGFRDSGIRIKSAKICGNLWLNLLRLGPTLLHELVNAMSLFKCGVRLIHAWPEIGVVSAFDCVWGQCLCLGCDFAETRFFFEAQFDRLLELVSLGRFHIVGDQPSLQRFFGCLLTMEASAG